MIYAILGLILAWLLVICGICAWLPARLTHVHALVRTHQDHLVILGQHIDLLAEQQNPLNAPVVAPQGWNADHVIEADR